jgi:hypothetical protein
MPQIWMTYEELAAMLNCTILQAREKVSVDRLDRKKSRDGKTRAKLSPAMIGHFVERLKTKDSATDLAVDELRKVHNLMRDRDGLTSGCSLQLLLSREGG